MPVNARRHVRKMRGGAQSHLIQADDGRWYVVKFRNNPQHRRILINEIVASVILRYLGIAAPEALVIAVAPEFLAEYPEVAIQLGSRREPVEPGWHFGSLYPGDPDKVPVFDFIPDALLREVANLDEFFGMLVFDKWTGNADGRQTVYFRSRLKEPRRPSTRPAFVAWMIDHGFIFNGPHWDFPDAPLAGLYHRPLVYESVRSLEDLRPWLGLVENFPGEVVDEALARVPLQWRNGDAEALESLLAKLLERRSRVPDLLEQCRRARPGLFPNWV